MRKINRVSRVRCWLAGSIILITGLSESQVTYAQTLPASLELLFQQGVEAQKANRLTEARQKFLEVLQRGGKVAFVYNNLGAVYQQMGNHAEAIPQFREAIRLQPDYPAPRFLLGASLLAVGQTADAVREFEQALRLDPNQAIGRLQLARAYEQSGNPLRSVNQYQKLVESHPRDVEMAYGLGRAYMRLSEWAFQRIREIDPQSPRLYQTLALNYHIQGHDELALRALQQAVAIDPTLPELHAALAEIYLAKGQFNEARAAIDKELAILPDSLSALTLKKKIESARPSP
ncbi:MAG: tetratricopeptide repeat protein [Acidobacteriota bacterium]